MNKEDLIDVFENITNKLKNEKIYIVEQDCFKCKQWCGGLCDLDGSDNPCENQIVKETAFTLSVWDNLKKHPWIPWYLTREEADSFILSSK